MPLPHCLDICAVDVCRGSFLHDDQPYLGAQLGWACQITQHATGLGWWHAIWWDLQRVLASQEVPACERGDRAWLQVMTGPGLAKLVETMVGALNAREIPTAGSILEHFNRDLVQKVRCVVAYLPPRDMKDVT